MWPSSLFDQPVDAGPPPVAGVTALAREASQSGAESASVGRGKKGQRLLQALAQGPLSRQQLSARARLPLSSVCSLLDFLVKAGRVESNGDFRRVPQDGGKFSKQERFRVRR